ncbi:MAG: 30S ribosomal protein S17 [Candidatus Nealsonbacteria bacterium]|nr:30S ribosomal protein S17 [Candidatus Nealsonbacteria bacterium]
MPKKQLTGNIVSAKTPKTVVVQVESIKIHKKYKKRFKRHKKYKAHVEGADYQLGDRVVIEETRPISKDKHWIVVAKKN